MPQESAETNDNLKPEGRLKHYWHMLGPGLTTGAADDDPAGVVTYSQAGAQFGFRMLWASVLTFPLMAVTQEMCARIGLVTGRGLAGAMRNHFPKWVLYTSAGLLFVANSFNIGADLGMMAEATALLIPQISPIYMVVVFTVASLGMQLMLSYRGYARYMKWLAMILFVYVLSGFVVDIDWRLALQTLILPDIRFGKDFILILTAVLGTTISPYLFFWQTSQEVEEQISEGKKTLKLREAEKTAGDIKKMRVDVWSGMFLSNLVMFFIIAVCAATLNQQGILTIHSAAAAAAALRPLAGNSAFLLFTLGIIGTGLLAVPVLAGSSSYAISESLGWRGGMYRKFRQAHAFYIVIIVSMLIGLMINFLHLDTVRVLIYASVFNAFIAPFILAIIVLLAANKKVMREHASKPLTILLGWGVTLLMLTASILTVWFWING